MTIFPMVPCIDIGIFRLQTGVGGERTFSTPKPSFPNFGDFDPHKGQTQMEHKRVFFFFFLPDLCLQLKVSCSQLSFFAYPEEQMDHICYSETSTGVSVGVVQT